MYNRRIEKIEVYLFIILVAIALVFLSCGKRYDQPFKQETITTDVVITDITVDEYTKVTGVIEVNDCAVIVDNGSTGYRYKTYDLNENEIIPQTFILSYYNDYKGYAVTVSDLDLTQYEVK